MTETLKILLYGNSAECKSAENMIMFLPVFDGNPPEFKCTDNWEGLESELVDFEPELVVILKNGAAGMEGVYLSKSRRPDAHTCWFSDDSDFGMQSHRLDCTYFSEKPVTEEKLHRAITRYTRMKC